VGVVERQEGWARIRTADDYSGWTPLSALLPARLCRQRARGRSGEPVRAHLSRGRRTAHAPLLTVPFESRLECGGAARQARWLQVRLPDGRAGWVQAGDIAFDAKPLGIPETIEFSKTLSRIAVTRGGDSSFATIARGSRRC